MIYLPKHKCSLTIEHNANRDFYQTVEQNLDEIPEDMHPDFESKESKERCIKENEIWTIQWYPRTPISFDYLAAPTLEELLKYAKKVEDEG